MSEEQPQKPDQLKTVATRVLAVIEDHLGGGAYTPNAESHLIGDLGADSLDLVEIVMNLEEEFGCEITDDDAEKYFGDNVRVKNIISYMERRIASGDAK